MFLFQEDASWNACWVVCVCFIINIARASVHKCVEWDWRLFYKEWLVAPVIFIVVFTHQVQANCFIYLCQESLPQHCLFKWHCLPILIWGWERLVPAWCCCCGPSSWLWCSCCAVLLPGCSCERTPAAHHLIGSACVLACCVCCLLGSWGLVGRRWCAAGGSFSSGSHCSHPSRSCLYVAPSVQCWT